MTPRQAIPKSWTDHLTLEGHIGIGFDQATSEGKTSNPAAIAVFQHRPPLYVGRLVVRWKSADERVSREIIDLIIGDITAAGRRVRRTCIDASNEVFHAQAVRNDLRGRCPVELVKGGESIEWRGLKYNYKTLLGNLYVSAFEDNFITLPEAIWLHDDHRLVKNDRGSYTADVAPDGSHADTFDAGKLALWALEAGRGPVTADPLRVGEGTEPGGGRPENPHAPGGLFSRFRRRAGILNT